MALTLEHYQTLAAPLPVDTGHELREGTLAKDKSWCMWLVYTEEGPVIERLNEVDPAWELTISRATSGDTCVAWGYLTVVGTIRHGVGEGSTDKAAATDLLKRLARLFGVGLYLKSAPMFWTNYGKDLKFQEKEAYKVEAAGKFRQWYQQQYGEAKSPRRPTPASEPQADPRESSDLDEHLGPRRPISKSAAPEPGENNSTFNWREPVFRQPFWINQKNAGRNDTDIAALMGISPENAGEHTHPEWLAVFGECEHIGQAMALVHAAATAATTP